MKRVVIKRDGTVEPWDRKRITIAISKAAKATNTVVDAEKLTDKVVRKLRGKSSVKVEQIQDIVEQTLVESNLYKVAKAYILYRKKHQEIREAARTLGITNTFHMPLNSLQVLASRYLRRNERREIIESPKQLFERVAKTVAEVDLKYGATKEEVKNAEEDFFLSMVTSRFMPNSPTLMNAGTPLGQLSACFVIPVEDSIEAVFDSIKWAALIHKSGGGCGYSFSHLRPAGDVVKSTGGIASGPVSFMRVFNIATEVIKQGGKRRGANLGALHVTHPDILDFITAKSREGVFENFNLSIGATDEFLNAVKRDDYYWLVNPRTGKKVRRVKAKVVWDLAIMEAWKTGDPGMLFLDTINKSVSNCIPKYGPIEATNPCGEQPLYPFESCNLGSINLSKFVDDNGKILWDSLASEIHQAVHFLDNVIDANKYPIPQLAEAVMRGRRIGLGVMGFADALIKMGVSYNSEEALDVAEKIMSFFKREAHYESQKIGAERGDFPDFEESVWYGKYKHMRNCNVTTVAPTGTISIIAGGCSSGIEPLFSVAYVRQVGESLGTNLFEINNQFERIAVREGFYSEELIEKISKKTSIQDVKEIPEDIRKLFVTAHDIPAEQHVKIQATFQKYVDNAISKTINFPETATPRDVENAYMLAWKLGCKGITVYRDKSRSRQVLSVS